MAEDETALSVAEIEDYLRQIFPQIYAEGDHVRVEMVGPMKAQLRFMADERHLRPGGTISGPAMFTAVDLALYVTILAQIGRKALAVTTSVTINFLRKPAPGDLVAACTLLKLGARLAVGEVTLYSGDDPQPVAHATGTYSIPPAASR